MIFTVKRIVYEVPMGVRLKTVIARNSKVIEMIISNFFVWLVGCKTIVQKKEEKRENCGSHVAVGL